MVLGLLPGGRAHPLRPRGAVLLPETHTWHLGPASVLGTPLLIRGAWARQHPTILGPHMLQHPN